MYGGALLVRTCRGRAPPHAAPRHIGSCCVTCCRRRYALRVALPGYRGSGFVSRDRCCPRANRLAIVPVFLNRPHDQLFDVLDCDVIAALDTDLLAYILGSLRLACDVETVAARDGYRPAARNNQIGGAFPAFAIARPILLILLIRRCGKPPKPAVAGCQCGRTAEYGLCRRAALIFEQRPGAGAVQHCSIRRCRRRLPPANAWPRWGLPVLGRAQASLS